MNLADRIEAATGPDRELDAEIWLAINRPGWRKERGWKRTNGWASPDRPSSMVNFYTPDGLGGSQTAPTYTASLDAAMMLVERGKGRWPQLYYTGPNPNNQRQGHRWAIWTAGTSKPFEGHSQHESALALAAAAIRAKGIDDDRN